MSKIRGHGGYWVLADLEEPLLDGDRGDPDAAPVLLDDPAPPPPALPRVLRTTIVHNAEYMVVTVGDTRPSRTTNGRGWGELLPVVRRVELASFRVAEDDASFIEVIGFTEGAELPAVYLKRGELFKFDRILWPTVERVQQDNDQKKARWVEVTLRGGTYERSVPPPFPQPGV